MTLLQFDQLINLDIRALHYSMAEDFREMMFLGLSKNKKVGVNTIYNHQSLCRLDLSTPLILPMICSLQYLKILRDSFI